MTMANEPILGMFTAPSSAASQSEVVIDYHIHVDGDSLQLACFCPLYYILSP